MGSVWGLAVHLLFFCWKAGVTASSAGLSISSPAPLVTTDNIQVPAFTQCVPPDTQSLKAETASKTLIATSTSSEVNSRDTQTISPIPETRNTTSPTASSLETQTTSPTLSSLGTQTTSPTASSLGTQTTSPTASSMGIQTTSPEASTLGSQTTFPTTEALKNQTIFPVELTLKTQTISSVTETRTLAIRIPSNFTVVHPIPTDTSDTLATSGSPRTGMSIVKSGTVSDPIEAIFDTLCTDDSSEEARKITIDLLTLAYTSTEAESLSSESSSSSDSSGGVLTSSRVLEPDIATPAKDSIAFSITHIKLTTCITEIETSVISGTPDTNHSPTGATASSTSEMLTWPQSPEAKLLSPKTTSSPGTLSASSTSVLATTLEGTLPIHVTVRETTVAQIPTSDGTLVTVSMNPLKKTSALSTETQGHTEVLGTITVPRSTMGKATSFSGSSTSDSSPSAGTTTKNSITSETLTADDMTSSSFLTGSHVLPFVSSTTASTSKKPNVPSAKTTASPKTAVKPPTPTPTAAWTRRTTKHGPGEDGGFLLVRLSVASPQDLTEPKATEKLMHQSGGGRPPPQHLSDGCSKNG
ncbi:unknown_gene_11201 [Phodopus roborovskii]|uniref:Unknown_gene_11201 protein n=1 Tax=Phodopus roborovskii TaxID=109678 RepID=A0AAU9ZKN6_PHORO|nr:unknown_gene_11201 [Phodopus roborovskii]